MPLMCAAEMCVVMLLPTGAGQDEGSTCINIIKAKAKRSWQDSWVQTNVVGVLREQNNFSSEGKKMSENNIDESRSSILKHILLSYANINPDKTL